MRPTFSRKAIEATLRMLVPAFPILSLTLAGSYILTPRKRWQASPTLSRADEIMPLPMWGVAFLVVGLALVVGMATKRSHVYEYSLAVLIGLLMVWAAVFAVAAFDGLGSYTAALWPTFALWVAAAVIVGLTSREGQQ